MSHRHYRAREYEGGYGGFAIGAIFTFVAILSIVFHYTGIDFIGMRHWGYWFFVPAFFIMLGSISTLVTDRRVKKDVELVLQGRQQGRYHLDEIAADAGVKRKHLLKVLMDLRKDGLVNYSYDMHTGEIILGESIDYEPAPDYVPLPKRTPPPAEGAKSGFCVYCGQKLDGAVNFCPNCGSQL